MYPQFSQVQESAASQTRSTLMEGIELGSKLSTLASENKYLKNKMTRQETEMQKMRATPLHVMPFSDAYLSHRH
jgi:hypothetical protein